MTSMNINYHWAKNYIGAACVIYYFKACAVEFISRDVTFHRFLLGGFRTIWYWPWLPVNLLNNFLFKYISMTIGNWRHSKIECSVLCFNGLPNLVKWATFCQAWWSLKESWWWLAWYCHDRNMEPDETILISYCC